MMTADELPPLDDRLFRSLLAADAALAEGETLQTQDPSAIPTLDCLLLLEQVWPRSRRSAARTSLPLSLGGAPRTFGRFEILEMLGQGGFGIVYLARDPVLGREVALKMPRHEVHVTAEVRRRFLREARAAAGLDHPNIVPVYEAAELGTNCYIASTFCPGPNLAAWLRRRSTPVPPELAARLMVPLVDAVQHAHEHEVLHRDIKPSNVILTGCSCSPPREAGPEDRSTQSSLPATWNSERSATARGPDGCVACGAGQGLVPRLTDFGLARIVEDVGDESRSGVPIGSPPYMAPEQAAGRSRETGPATDVYALGATLYEVLTGRPPFRGETPTETLRLVLEEDPVSPRVLRPGLPTDLETICMKCLSKGQAQRYPTAAALRDDLQRYLDGEPIRARPLTVWHRTARLVRRKPADALAVVLGVLLAAGLLGAVLYRAALLERYTQLLQAQAALAAESVRLSHRHIQASQLRQAKQRVDAGKFERAQGFLSEIEPADEAGGGIKWRYAWEYLWHQSRRVLKVLSRRKEQVSRIALSADGEVLASGDVDGTVRLRDPVTGELRATLRGHNFRVYRLAFSPDGGKLASAAWADAGAVRDEVLIWDLKQLRVLARLDGHGGDSIHLLQFDARGNRLWCNGKPEDGHPTLGLWDLAGDPENPRLLWQGRTFSGLPLTGDGERVAIQGAGARIEITGTPGDRNASVRGPRVAPHTLTALSRSGRLMAYHRRGSRKVVVRDLTRGTDECEFDEIGGVQSRLEFSHDERYLFSANHQGELVVRDLATRRVLPFAPDAPDDAVCYAEIAPRGHRLAYTYNGRQSGPHAIRIVDTETGSVVATYPGEIERVDDLIFTADGNALLVRTTEALVRWELSPPPEAVQPAGHGDEAWALAFSPEGTFLASGSDDTDDPRTIKIWDVASGGLVSGWSAGAGTVSVLAFNTSGKILASGHLEPSDNVKLWDPATARHLGTLAGHTDRVRSIAFTPDGRLLATGSSDRTLRIWDPERRKLLRTLTGHTDAVMAVAFSDDGVRVASASNDRTLRIWNLQTGETTVLTWVEKFSGLVFLPGGRVVAASDEDGRITFWDVASRTCIQTIDTEDAELRCLALSPDGQTVAAAGMSHQVRLWDVLTGQELLTLDGHEKQINRVLFSPDGKTLASCSHDGAVRLWRTQPRKPIPAAGGEPRPAVAISRGP
ncbi:MAG: protein kinase [Isosphaeraceae bacterium]